MKIRKTYGSENTATKKVIQEGIQSVGNRTKSNISSLWHKQKPGKKQSLILRRYESDQLRVSPNNNHTSSRRKVIRIKTLVNDMVFSCCFTKLFRQISQEMPDNG